MSNIPTLLISLFKLLYSTTNARKIGVGVLDQYLIRGVQKARPEPVSGTSRCIIQQQAVSLRIINQRPEPSILGRRLLGWRSRLPQGRGLGVRSNIPTLLISLFMVLGSGLTFQHCSSLFSNCFTAPLTLERLASKNCFKLHYSTVSGIVKNHKSKWLCTIILFHKLML